MLGVSSKQLASLIIQMRYLPFVESICRLPMLVIMRTVPKRLRCRSNRRTLEAIINGALLSWQHVNLLGEWDFRQAGANDKPFDTRKIRGFKVLVLVPSRDQHRARFNYHN